MATHTVEAVMGEPREWQSQHGGKFLSYTLALSGREGMVELSQKPETAAPKAGDSIEGEIVPSNGNFPPKFRKAKKEGFGGGGFSGGGMSPEREKRIVRQHSAEMALRYAAIQQARGALPDDFSLDRLRPIIDWFDKDTGV